MSGPFPGCCLSFLPTATCSVRLSRRPTAVDTLSLVPASSVSGPSVRENSTWPWKLTLEEEDKPSA